VTNPATGEREEAPGRRIGERVAATAGDLTPAVAEALEDPPEADESTVLAASIPFHVLSWGTEADPPVLLVHGVTSSARVWRRIGPALAAAGFHVVAPDLPGHGRTGHWRGRHRFRDTAADLAAFIRAAGLDRGDLRVVGHSWGAMTVAALPAAGLRPAMIVLLDPPALQLPAIASLLEDPGEQPYDDFDEAVRAVRLQSPAWTAGDVAAKAADLLEFDEAAVREILLQNGDWDGGLGDLADPAAEGLPVWLIRGDPANGGYVADAALPAFADRLGAERIVTIAGAPHSPQRTHPEATTVALLQALGPP
jgi:pimeloyl-ACP methyl ester carboxylesterase